MGSDNTFNDTDLADLKKQPGIDAHFALNCKPVQGKGKCRNNNTLQHRSFSGKY